MPSYYKSKVQQKIWQILRDMNDTWLKGRSENLANFFHENMVIIHENFREREEGKAACVKSFENFCNQATIHNFKAMDPQIDAYTNTAVANYRSDISFKMNDETYHDTGHDLFVFLRERDEWQAVWRTVILLSRENKSNDKDLTGNIKV